jgi:serine/threonine-protein kinase
MGEVWASTDLLLARTVAVKLLRPEHAGDEELLARFRAEAVQAGAVSHPNIAQVFDFYEEPPSELIYLVMEFVDGPSLARLLADGSLDPAHTMDIISQAARGLDAAHQAGVLHRDVKPGNLLVRGDGLVKLSDFGIARSVGSAPVTRTGFLPGTPAFMAPERATGTGATTASDVYSLGIVAYECLTGQLPFQGSALEVAMAHVERELPPLPPTVPAPVAALVADLTSKDPAARPSAAEAACAAARVRDRLSKALEGSGTLGFPAVPAAVTRGRAAHARSLTARTTRRSVLAPLALSGIAVVGLIGWMMAAARTAPTAPSSPVPAATSGPGHPHTHPAPVRVPPGGAATMTPAASRSPRPRVSQNVAAAPSPSAIPTPSSVPTPSPTAAPPTPTPPPTPDPTPSATPTAPAVTPPPE